MKDEILVGSLWLYQSPSVNTIECIMSKLSLDLYSAVMISRTCVRLARAPRHAYSVDEFVKRIA